MCADLVASRLVYEESRRRGDESILAAAMLDAVQSGDSNETTATGAIGGPDAIEEVFVELLDASGQLPDLDASQQDAWVSGLLASWRMDVVVEDPAQTDAEFLAWCEARSHNPVALEIATVMGRLSGDDMCEVAGCWLVESAGGVGGSASAVLGFEHLDGSGHCVLAEIDDNGWLIDLHVGPSAEDMLPDAETLAEMDAALVVHENDPAETMAAIADAWRRAATLHQPGQPVAEGLLLNQLVAAARLRGLVGDELPAFVSAEHDPIVQYPDMTDEEIADANLRTLETLQRALPSLAIAVPAPGVSEDEASALLDQAGLPLKAGPTHLSLEEREALAFLEWADWLGVMLGLGRSGPSATMTGESMVDWINRCPEVTTSVSKRDRPYVVFGLNVAAAWWADLGLIDDGVTTALGDWALPRSAALVWGASANFGDQ